MGSGPHWGIDCNKQYSTCLYKMEGRWPQFSLLDRPEPFDGTITPGYYHVIDFQARDDPSWEGPGAYPHIWVNYHMNETKRLRMEDVTEMLRSSFSYDQDIFQSTVRELYVLHGDSIGKKACNLAVGMFDIRSMRT